MKVIREHHWIDHRSCIDCRSFLAVEKGDIILNNQGDFYFICPVCDSKNSITVPDYIQRKLRELLNEKTSIDKS